MGSKYGCGPPGTIATAAALPLAPPPPVLPPPQAATRTTPASKGTANLRPFIAYPPNGILGNILQDVGIYAKGMGTGNARKCHVDRAGAHRPRCGPIPSIGARPWRPLRRPGRGSHHDRDPGRRPTR